MHVRRIESADGAIRPLYYEHAYAVYMATAFFTKKLRNQLARSNKMYVYRMLLRRLIVHAPALVSQII